MVPVGLTPCKGNKGCLAMLFRKSDTSQYNGASWWHHLSAYAGVLRRRAALAAPILNMRMSREEQVTLGASFRLAP